MTKPKQTPALFTAKVATEEKTASPSELERLLAYPAEPISSVQSTGTLRRPIDDLVPRELSPKTVIETLKNAHADPRGFASMLTAIIRRDAKLRSVITTRVLAVVGNDIVVEPGGPKLQDRKAAEAVQELINGDAVQQSLPWLLFGGLFYGYAAGEAVWDLSARPQTIKSIERIPHEWIAFDNADGKTPLIAPAKQGDGFLRLGEGKLVWHAPGLLPGLPITNGLGYTAAFYYALKNIVLRNWSQFIELYGQPMRVGKYPSKSPDPDALRKDQAVLKKALQNLGTDAWAMLPDNFQLEFIDAATRSSSSEAYERICRYLDEAFSVLASGGVLTGSTGNTGYGGSQSLGTVHNEVRMDIVKADAKDFAATCIRKTVVVPFTKRNFGPGVAVPRVRFHIEEPEDLQAITSAVAKLVPLGWKVSASQLREKFGLRPPEGEDDVLGSQAAPAAQQVPDNPTDDIGKLDLNTQDDLA